jgi:DNA-binding transcriptional ArsR family regulator
MNIFISMDTFNALAKPNRRRLLEAIRQEPCTLNMLVTRSDLSQPAVSKHLRYLREADLVAVKPDGQKRWYELNPTPPIEIEEFLEPYRQLPLNRRDALERHFESRSQAETKEPD